MGGKVPGAELFITGCFSTLPMAGDEIAQGGGGGCGRTLGFCHPVGSGITARQRGDGLSAWQVVSPANGLWKLKLYIPIYGEIEKVVCV